MMSDVLEELVQEMSTNGLFVPDTSITIQNVVGEGINFVISSMTI